VKRLLLHFFAIILLACSRGGVVYIEEVRLTPERCAPGEEVVLEVVTVEGVDVTLSWYAPGGSIDSEVWTAPQKTGLYAILAIAADPDGETDTLAGFVVVADSAVTERQKLLRDTRFWAYQIQALVEDGAIDALVATHYDMLVLDNARTDKEDVNFDMKGAVSRLKSSNGSSGQRKLVLCYIDIAEAETWRWYWQSGWGVGNPDFIVAPDPDGWEDNYPVKYWDPDWQAIMYGNDSSYIAKILDDGFDGIYMDWIEACRFEDVMELHPDPDQAMIDFVGAMADYAHSVDPDFLVVAQNATELGVYPDWLAIIDAEAQEQVLFDGDSDPKGAPGDYRMDPTGEFSTTYYINNLRLFQAEGIPCFVCDYAEKKHNVEEAYEHGASQGFIEYVSTRQLEKLTDNPPPGY